MAWNIISLKLQATCFYHIHRLHQLRHRVSQEVTQKLVLALVTSRLDYCNSLLAGLPKSSLEPLQRVQNAATWLMYGVSHFDHVTPSLIQLHWLPVSYRIKYKLCCLIHAVRYDRILSIWQTLYSQPTLLDCAVDFVPTPVQQWTTLCHGFALSSVIEHSHILVCPHGTLFPTTYIL